MTPAQVKELFPAVHSPTTEGQKPAKPGVALLYLDDVKIVGRSFTACFAFEGSGLVSVALELAPKESIGVARNVYDALTEGLRAKYGAELTREGEGDIGFMAKRTWVSEQTTIALTILATKPRATVSIRYDGSLAKDAAKL